MTKFQPSSPIITKYGTPLTVLSTQNGYLLKNPELGAEIDRSHPVHFLTSFYVYKIDDSHRFFYVQEPAQKYWGWIEKGMVLSDFTAMKDSSGRSNEYAKIIVKNNGDNLYRNQQKGIPAYQGPEETFEIVDYVEPSTVLYIYKTIHTRNDKHFFLVGFEPTWDPIFPEKKMLGWINEKNCIHWKTRLGVSFLSNDIHERNPIGIYASKSDLKEYAHSESNEHAVVVENPIMTLSSENISICYPVIQENDSYLQIAFNGQPIKQSMKYKGTELSGTEDIQHLENVVTDSSHIDILIWVCDIENIDMILRSIDKNINNILKANNDRKIRITFSIYGNHSMNNIFEYMSPYNESFAEAQTNALSAKLPSITISRKNIYDIIPSMIKSVDWKDTHVKYLMFIGNVSDTTKNTRKEKHVVKLLKEKDIGLYVVHAEPDGKVVDKFRNQIESIIERAKSSIKYYRYPIDKLASTTDNEMVFNDVFEDLYQQSLNHIVKTLFIQLDDPNKEYQTYNNLIYRDKYGYHLLEKGVSPFDMLGLLTQNICDLGWIYAYPKNENKKVIEWSYYVKQTELDEMIGILSQIVYMKQSDEKKFGLKIKSIIKNISNIDISDHITLKDFFKNTYGFPENTILSNLNFTLPELEIKIHKDIKFRSNFFKIVGKIYESFHLIQEGKTAELQWNSSLGQWRRHNISEKNRWHTTQSGFRYTWVPLDSLTSLQ